MSGVLRLSAVRRWLEKLTARVGELVLEANTSSIVLARPAKKELSSGR